MSTPDQAAIEQTIQTYFDGLYEGDADKLGSVFHDNSALTWDLDGKISVLPRDAWLKMVRERPSAKSQNLARDDAILLLDQSGPTTAFVKVKCQIPPRYFTDYLNLLKTNGKWLIVQKVYAFEVRQ
ncbi:MAG: nuclear transport factor 2 family protein [Burkholderiaceae bacterium]|nr:nuclear transport factor 2 family protein [Burkholderiaceae bacterium]